MPDEDEVRPVSTGWLGTPGAGRSGRCAGLPNRPHPAPLEPEAIYRTRHTALWNISFLLLLASSGVESGVVGGFSIRGNVCVLY